MLTFECSASAGPAGLELLRDDRGQPLQRVLEPVVDDDVGELGLSCELVFGDVQPALHLRRIVGPATDKPCTQSFERGRGDEHLNGAGNRAAHLAGALHLDLEHDRHARTDPVLELRAQRPVAAPGIVGVLDELAEGDPPVELGAVEEVVVDPVALARARRARSGRHGQLE